MPADPTARAVWWRHPVFQQMEAEIANLQTENDRLRALLAPPSMPFPSRWGLTPQQAKFLTLLYTRAGCVPHERLAAALAGPRGPIGRPQLQVIACNARRKIAPHGIEIEAYRGAGYGLSLEGRAVVRRAIDAIERLRRV